MDDPRLTSQLRAIEEPVAADPGFLDRLFEELAEEVGLRPTRNRSGAPPVQGRAVRSRRRRRWLPPLLVAAVVLGGGLAIAAGAGAVLQRHDQPSADVPNLCALVTTAELAAILGAPVASGDPGSSSPGPYGSCMYAYGPGRPGGPDRNFESWISRPPDLPTAWSQILGGMGGARVEGVGDAAIFFNTPGGAPTATLYVLRAPYMLSVGYLQGAGQTLTRQQMEDLARLIVARL